MRKNLSITFTVFLLVGLFSGALVSGAGTIDPTTTAVYLNGGFDGNSVQIDGNIYSANGNVQFNNAGDNAVTGSIYLNTAKSFTIPQWYTPDFQNRVVKLDNTVFNETLNDLSDFPTISKTVDSFTADYWPLPNPDTITENTYYKSLTIKNYLKVDVSNGDITLVVDNFDMQGSGYLELVGSGNLNLYVTNSLHIASSCRIKNGDNAAKTQIFFKGSSMNLESTTLFANMYLSNPSDAVSVGGSFTLTGNVVTAAATVAIKDAAKIYGVVYAPVSDVTLSNSGSIYGRLVANSLTVRTGKVTYDPSHATFTLPASATKHTLTVTASPAGAGTVSPDSQTVNYGETVSVSASANSGYEFTGFTSSNSSVPDADGKITVVSDTVLTANFKTAVTEEPPAIDIPDGPSLINFPYAYLYGNEDGTAGATNNIKREEAAALLYRLLKQDNKIGGYTAGSVTPYTNIEENRWSKSALEYMKYIGVYTTDYISARADVTRGEVAKLVCFSLRLRPDSSKTVSFTDLSVSNPYYNYIKALADIDVLQGFDNQIQPDKAMTRAEFVTMMNRIISRDDDYVVDDSINPYSDLQKTDWYYEDVMRASFGYADDKTDGVYPIVPSRKPDRYSIDYN